MKLLKTLIYRNVASCTLLLAMTISANNLSFEIGIYDFTDEAAKEFYKIAPSLFLCLETIRKSKLSFNISSGLSATMVKYNKKWHNLFMIPLFLSTHYNFIDSNSILQPFIGGGFSLQGKFDKNQSFTTPHSSITYGYHMLAGLKFPINTKIIFFGTLRYNVLIPPYFEDLNTNGIISTMGFKFTLRKENKNYSSPIRNALNRE